MESAERVSNVLLAFTSRGPVLGVTDIARELGIPKSAVHRTLATLCRTGLVRQEASSRKYVLGLRAVDLGLAALDHGDIRAGALPLMRRLTDDMGETTTLSLLAGRERFYAAQVESSQDVRMTVEIGLRCPLYAGASGRVLLATFDEPLLDEYLRLTDVRKLTEYTIVDPTELRANLAQVRLDGYAFGYGERDPWAASIAAAFRDRTGTVLGCLSVCGPAGRFEANVLEQHAGAVVQAAEELSIELGAATKSSEANLGERELPRVKRLGGASAVLTG